MDTNYNITTEILNTDLLVDNTDNLLDIEIKPSNLEKENIIIESNEIIKKKRGRKPKNRDIETVSSPISKIIKKRGRKTNSKIINLKNDDEVDIITNIIVHLPLKMNDILKITNDESHIISEDFQDIQNNICIENNSILTSFDWNQKENNYLNTNENICNLNTDNDFCKHCVSLQEKINILEQTNEKLKNGILDYNNILNKKIYYSSIKLINKTEDTIRDDISNSNIVCWWCCHKVDGIPLGIPEIISKNIFYVYGYFCSFNCMMAYNIDINDYKIWNRQTNIYQMKNFIDVDNKFSIHCAPPRQLLDIFGGPYNILEFRKNFYLLNQEFRNILPPMIPIINIIEEDYKNINITKNIKPNNKPIIFRKKPLPKQGNILVNII
jgi:hypothetical protein